MKRFVLACAGVLAALGCSKPTPQDMERDFRNQLVQWFSERNREAELARLEWITWKYRKPDRDTYGKEPKNNFSRYVPGDPPPPRVTSLYVFDDEGMFFDGLVCDRVLEKFDDKSREIKKVVCGYPNQIYYIGRDTTMKYRCLNCGEAFDLKAGLKPEEISVKYHIDSSKVSRAMFDVKPIEVPGDSNPHGYEGHVRYIRYLMYLDEDPRINRIPKDSSGVASPPVRNDPLYKTGGEERYPSGLMRISEAWLEELDIEYRDGNLKVKNDRPMKVMDVHLWVQFPKQVQPEQPKKAVQ